MATKRARGRAAKGKRRAKARPKARRAAARRTAGGRSGRARPKRAKPARRKTRRPASRKPTVAAAPARAPRLERERRRLSDAEDTVPGPPSSLNVDEQTASAARTGRRELLDALHAHTETSPELTGGDVDADWENAYSVGDEAPGGDNPTPDQDRVDDIGRALGVEYEDNEELKGANKITKRDRKRWELDPASAEDYKER
jgi:hypothetical protein